MPIANRWSAAMPETDANTGSYTFTVIATAEPAIAEEKRVEALTQWLLDEYERERKEASDEETRCTD
jgi:hypothetical protein